VKQHAPAAARNRDAIAQVLAGVLPESGLVLEIASGTGEHAVHFARAFPGLEWQPSDPVTEARDSIESWRQGEGLANMRPPLALDAEEADWPIPAADAVLCINMIHISPWTATQGLFSGVSRVLGAGAPLVLYGPYFEDGTDPAPSNLAFDASLKARNPAWGIRRIEDVDMLAAQHGFERVMRVEMPANNLTLAYRKR
jgi:hypothetical protein